MHTLKTTSEKIRELVSTQDQLTLLKEQVLDFTAKIANKNQHSVGKELASAIDDLTKIYFHQKVQALENQIQTLLGERRPSQDDRKWECIKHMKEVIGLNHYVEFYEPYKSRNRPNREFRAIFYQMRDIDKFPEGVNFQLESGRNFGYNALSLPELEELLFRIKHKDVEFSHYPI